jgi:hypothetical protein
VTGGAGHQASTSLPVASDVLIRFISVKPSSSTTAATKLALRLLGERYQALDELARVDAELDRLTTQAAPELRQLFGGEVLLTQ